MLLRIRGLELLELRVARLDAIFLEGRELSNRIKSLEMVVDTLLESRHYYSAKHLGFNGQTGRKKIFTDLVSILNFQLIAETGTWTGNTTGYMAEVSGLPIRSAEISARFHHVAKLRLNSFSNVKLYHDDSRKFLQDMVDASLHKQFTFFYLDAHWLDDIPLNEEISFIATQWKQFVIMIDDFQVPGDLGYAFDDYGTKKALTVSFIESIVNKYYLIMFFPADSSEHEDGAKRGSVILASNNEIANCISKLPSLRKYN